MVAILDSDLVCHHVEHARYNLPAQINQDRTCSSTDFYLHKAWPECAGAHVVGDAEGQAKAPPRIVMSGVDLVTPRGVAIATGSFGASTAAVL